MKKIGFSGQCPNGDISALTNQIKMCKEADVDSLEIPIFETDVICGKNINLNFELPFRYEKYYKENIVKARQLLEKL